MVHSTGRRLLSLGTLLAGNCRWPWGGVRIESTVRPAAGTESTVVGQGGSDCEVEYSMELLRLLVFGTFVIVVLVGLLYFADALHVFSDEGTSAADEGADSEPERFDTGSFRFDIADTLSDVIGTYGEIPIHRYAQIGGASYEFDHVYCPAGKMVMQADARCLAPGLVYSPLRQDAARSG